MVRYPFAFMLKSYRNDIEYAKKAIDTFEKYNIEHIHLFLVIPRDDEDLFMNVTAGKSDITIFFEEDMPVEFVTTPINGIMPGYINQEIIKLAFWKTGFCENYLCLDSEVYFIRPFRLNEFVRKDNVPYTVLIEDRDLKSNNSYFHGYWKEREKKINLIADMLGYHTEHLLTCHGFQTFSCKVLQNFEEEFLQKNHYKYADILKIAPYEFSWYNIWLQKTKIIPIYVCEPHFKTFHMAYQQFQTWIVGDKEEDLARGYVGIVINGNYAKRPRYIEDLKCLNINITDKEKQYFLLRMVCRSICKRWYDNAMNIAYRIKVLFVIDKESHIN